MPLKTDIPFPLNFIVKIDEVLLVLFLIILRLLNIIILSNEIWFAINWLDIIIRGIWGEWQSFCSKDFWNLSNKQLHWKLTYLFLLSLRILLNDWLEATNDESLDRDIGKAIILWLVRDLVHNEERPCKSIAVQAELYADLSLQSLLLLIWRFPR